MKEPTGEDVERITRTIDANCEFIRKASARESTTHTIFRVPAHICRGREDLFHPHVVSVGPYHHGKEELREMQKVKWRFLDEIREKSPVCLGACVERLKDLEEAARACYSHEFHHDRHEFIQMLLLDSCFIIQLLIKWKATSTESYTFLKSMWNFGMIRHDLLLLENQIPFFVLREMFRILLIPATNVVSSPLNGMAIDFLMPLDSTSRLSMIIAPSDIHDIHHLLHLFYCCHIQRPAAAAATATSSYSHRERERERERERGTNYIPGCFKRRVSSLTSSYFEATPAMPAAHEMIPSATRLVEAGVTLRKKMTTDNFLDISFSDGRLEIPSFVINASMTTHRWSNLLALEQCVDVGRALTSYAAFMDCLIDTSDDVEILRRKGILTKMMSSNQEVADFFNQLCSYSFFDPRGHYLAKLFEEVNDYCSSNWHGYIAKLVRGHFSKAWASISLVSTMVLLILTFL